MVVTTDDVTSPFNVDLEGAANALGVGYNQQVIQQTSSPWILGVLLLLMLTAR